MKKLVKLGLLGVGLIGKRHAEIILQSKNAKLTAVADPDHRSNMNVTFNFGQERLLEKFLSESEKDGLFALNGHASVGGIRASIYNAMPLDGVKQLADFMKEFERING